MKLGIIISQTDPETVWNAYRFGVYALEQGDSVKTTQKLYGTHIGLVYMRWNRGILSKHFYWGRVWNLKLNILNSTSRNRFVFM